MSADITRRHLLKLSLGVAAAAAVGIPLTADKAAAQASLQASDIAVEKWVKGVCRFCGTGCGVYIGVKGGKVVGMKGNPNAKTNFGFLCVKGALIHKFVHHPDRLTTPLIRDAGGVLQKATWNEALDLVAGKIKEFQGKYGRDSVAYYGSGQCTTEESYTFNKFFKGGLRTNNVDGNPRLCMASAVAGYLTSIGSDEPAGTYQDIESAKCFFLTGSNASEAHPVLFRRIWDRKKKDPTVKIIVCEPRRTKTSHIADLWLPIDPGTDLAVFHAMAYEIIKNEWHDKAYMEKLVRITDGEKTYTLEDYTKHLSQFEADTAAKLSRCPADKIRQAAEWFAKSGATMSLWCMGLNQRSRGVWANNLIHNLHLITGNYGKPGADAFSLTGQPNACGGVRETGSLSHLLPGCRPVVVKPWRDAVGKAWNLAEIHKGQPEFEIEVEVDGEKKKVPAGYIKPTPGLPTMAMFGAFGAESDTTKPVKMIITSTTNPAQTLPHLNKYVPGMQAGFLVTIDIFPTRTTQLANVVLPSAFLYEKGGVYGCSERRSQLTEKAVNPPGEAKPDIWIAAQLAKRLGLEKLIPWNMDDSMKAGEMAWNDYTTVTAPTEKTLKGATYARLKKSLEGVQWPCPDEKHPGTYKRYVRKYDPMFNSPAYKDKIPAGAAEFFYVDGKGEGKANIFMRGYAGAAEVPDKDYPFWLTTGRVVEQWHTSTMTGRIPETARAHPNSFIEINPGDAKKLGISNGDMVRVASRRGENIIPAKLIEATNPDVVFIPMHDQQKSRMVNFICNDAVDPVSGEPEYKICAVKLERVSGPVDVAEQYVISDVNSKF